MKCASPKIERRDPRVRAELLTPAGDRKEFIGTPREFGEVVKRDGGARDWKLLEILKD